MKDWMNIETQPLPSFSARPVQQPGRKRFRRRWRRWIGIFALIVLLGTGAIFISGSIYLVSLPSVNDAEARIAALLHAHHAKDTGLPPAAKVGQAIVAVEDERFYSHHGIDSIGLLRSAWADISSGSIVQGGSTITEQLAKALYVTDDHTLGTKIPMMGMAVKLENQYSKAQILEMYLNAIYFGDGQWGVAQASQAYFGKTPAQLDWAEASLLAGLPQAPSDYDPTRHFALARQRQYEVLGRLISTGVLSRSKAKSAYAELTSLNR